MKAIAKDKDQAGFSLIDIEEPKCSSFQVLIKPRACGVCGTDMYIYRWKEWLRDMMQPHLPVAIGHEFGGEIVETGSEVKDLQTGDWVVVEPIVSCSNCFLCKTGRPNICQKCFYIGMHCNGAMAELVAAPGVNCYKIPPGIPLADISLIEVLATGIHALERVGSVAGATVTILGVGAIGLLLARAARAYGAAKIIIAATSSSQSRLEAARKMDVDEMIMVDKEDLIQRVQDLTGDGADVVFDATGTVTGCKEALEIGRRGSQVVLLGPCDVPVPILPQQLILKEIDILSSSSRVPSSWYTAIHLLGSGKISLENLIDARFPLSEGLKAFELLEKREITKAVIEP